MSDERSSSPGGRPGGKGAEFETPTHAPLRSRSWYGGIDRDGFNHRTTMRSQGLPAHLFDGRPVIGICNTWSDLTPCNGNFRQLAEYVKRGVYEMGGFPVEFPAMSLGETNMRPSTMMFRNLVAMEVEESIRANPIDGVILLVGCDKTTPALVMGAASCGLPTLVVSGGPMLNGKYRGKNIGSGTDVYKFAEEVRAGKMGLGDFMDAEISMSRSSGTCMTMGTASTMACLMEAMGIALPTNGSIPAVDARRFALAHMAGRRIVEMVKEELSIDKILTRQAFENAIVVTGALGGSTNAVVHLLAVAGRLGVPLTLGDWDLLGRDVPCLVNLMPSGKYLMEDFYYAGGLSAVVKELGDRIHLDALTVTGQTIRQNYATAECFDRDVIFPIDAPFQPHGGIAVLSGNLAPNGAIIKPSAASPALMQHTGRAVVFDDIDDYRRRINDLDLEVSANDVLVLKNCGPRGYPGFPEVGNMAIPLRLIREGVTDMVRISDARMSGTAYGAVVLHVAPEAAVGGPLALVETGDIIELDVAARRIEAKLTPGEFLSRKQMWTPPAPPSQRGWQRLFHEHVLQADRGVDLDFLVGASGAPVPRESE